MPSAKPDRLDISTNVAKDSDFRQLLHFKVSARAVDQYGEPTSINDAAHLSGYYMDLDFEDIQGYFDFFDSQDGDGLEAFSFIKSNATKLQAMVDDSPITRIVFMDKLWVDPEYRGQQLGNRLLREAAHITTQGLAWRSPVRSRSRPSRAGALKTWPHTTAATKACGSRPLLARQI